MVLHIRCTINPILKSISAYNNNDNSTSNNPPAELIIMIIVAMRNMTKESISH